MSRPIPRTSQVFVILTGDRAVLAFEAMSGPEARSLAQELWVVDELKERGLYVPPPRPRATGLKVRIATADEAAAYTASKIADMPPDDNDDLFTFYLA